jgi:cephalosporin hydroxylase
MSSSIGDGAQQLEGEILPFLEFAEPLAPQRICEIGTASGGTNFLLSHGLASTTEIIAIDLFVRNRIRLRALIPHGTSIHLVDGSSYDSSTVARVERLLDGNKLDVLFIDGDHRYAGALADFLAYRPFVRDGGLIVFHDIQPDGRERGLRSRQNSGGVPLLWRQLRPAFEHREFIGSPSQLGFGIGVLVESSNAKLPPEVATTR